MALQRERNESKGKFLTVDLLYEILRRVDAVTLARASCVSSEFRSICEDEANWERICYSRWPSTKEPSLKSLVSSMGGFRNLYANCFSCISGYKPVIGAAASTLLSSKDELEEEVLPTDFISVVDIAYKGDSVLTRTIVGIPGAEDFLGWFANCPFRIDLLESPEEVDSLLKDEEGITSITFRPKLPSISSVENEIRDGKVWNAICDNMRVSWILFNKKSMRMVNLASWKCLGGSRHWPCDGDFLLRFGSILPGAAGASTGASYCNIAMNCRMTCGGDSVTTMSITELSMQLENVDGARLYGRESLRVLANASNCEKITTHSEVLDSYHEFLRGQNARKETKIRQESRREVAAAVVSGVCACLCLCYVLF